MDPTRRHHELQRQMALDRQRARRGGHQLAELVPHDPVHPKVHGEHPGASVLVERGDAGVPELHGRVAHEQRRHRVGAPRALERHRQRGAAEALLPVERRRLELVVVDGHAPVGVRDGEHRGEVVGQHRGDRRGAEVEAGQRRGGDGDLDRPRPVDEPDEEREEADEDAHADEGSYKDAERAHAAWRRRRWSVVMGRTGAGHVGDLGLGVAIDNSLLLMVHGWRCRDDEMTPGNRVMI